MREDGFTIIDNTEEARVKHGRLWGASEAIITIDDIVAVLNGKCLAIALNYEYVTFITLNKGENDMNEKSLLFSVIVTIGTMHTFEVALKENGYTIKSKVVNPENFNVLFILEADRPDYEFLEFKENLKDIVEFV